MQTKVSDQMQKQQESVEKIIAGLTLSADEMDGLIEKIYAIAAEYRDAGKQERDIERQMGISLAGVKKLAKNWTKQKKCQGAEGKSRYSRTIR